MPSAGAILGFALYRGLCFTLELSHMRKRARASRRQSIEAESNDQPNLQDDDHAAKR
jgi:hypothetical protein